MSDDRGNRFSWVWVFIAIGVVRMAGSACSGPSTPSRSKQRGGPPLATVTVPTLENLRAQGAARPGAASTEKPDDWVLLVRFPARAAAHRASVPASIPASVPGREAPDMNALVERARKEIGRPGTLVPPLEPPPPGRRAPPRP